MINRTVLVGRLTKDPDLKVTQSNISVVNFTLAVNRPFKSKDGDQQADFIQVVAFRKQAESVNQYLKKGSLAGVDGRLQSRSYENKEGQRVFVTEIIADSVQFLEPKGQSGSSGGNGDSYQNSYSGGGQTTGTNTQQSSSKRDSENPFANADGAVDISDDDLPF